MEYRYTGNGYLLWSTSYKLTLLSFQWSIDIQARATCSDQLLTNLLYCLFNRVPISRHWPLVLINFLSFSQESKSSRLTLALINFLRTDIITLSNNHPVSMPLLINSLIEPAKSLHRVRLPAFACLLWSTAFYSCHLCGSVRISTLSLSTLTVFRYRYFQCHGRMRPWHWKHL